MFPLLGLLLYSCLAIIPNLVEATTTCPGGVYAIVASGLTGYAPAITYCSSKYPLAAITSTIYAPTRTATYTVATNSLSSTVSTTTST